MTLLHIRASWVRSVRSSGGWYEAARALGSRDVRRRRAAAMGIGGSGVRGAGLPAAAALGDRTGHRSGSGEALCCDASRSTGRLHRGECLGVRGRAALRAIAVAGTRAVPDSHHLKDDAAGGHRAAAGAVDGYWVVVESRRRGADLLLPGARE